MDDSIRMILITVVMTMTTLIMAIIMMVKAKVKQSCYRPGVACNRRVSGS
jgi:hypothetical protein